MEETIGDLDAQEKAILKQVKSVRKKKQHKKNQLSSKVRVPEELLKKKQQLKQIPVLSASNLRDLSDQNTILLLGKVVALDERLAWRMKWAQRSVVASASIGIFFYVLNSQLYDSKSVALNVIMLTLFATVILPSIGMIYYKNVSFAITRRLLREVNVVVIIMLAISVFIIDCVKPYNSASPLNGFAYCVSVILFVLIDAVKKKNKAFILTVGVLAMATTLYNIYRRVFANVDVGIILFQYGDDYVFHKRSIKRSIFTQIFLFSMSGVWVMFKDKKMEMMMFATGNIYRETGTASKYVDHESYVQRMQSEEERGNEIV